MPSTEQFEYFKLIYATEMERGSELVNRAKIYLSVITLYMGLLGIAANSVIPLIADSWFAVALYFLGFLAFVSALVLVVLAMGVYNYVYPTDPENVFLGYDPDWPENDQFFRLRMAELAAAFKHNHPLNERRATCLKRASLCMLLGVGCHTVVLPTMAYLR